MSLNFTVMDALDTSNIKLFGWSTMHKRKKICVKHYSNILSCSKIVNFIIESIDILILNLVVP